MKRKRPGRKKLPTQDKRTPFAIRLSPPERKRLERTARALGLPPTVAAREILLAACGLDKGTP